MKRLHVDFNLKFLSQINSGGHRFIARRLEHRTVVVPTPHTKRRLLRILRIYESTLYSTPYVYLCTSSKTLRRIVVLPLFYLVAVNALDVCTIVL